MELDANEDTYIQHQSFMHCSTSTREVEWLGKMNKGSILPMVLATNVQTQNGRLYVIGLDGNT